MADPEVRGERSKLQRMEVARAKLFATQMLASETRHFFCFVGNTRFRATPMLVTRFTSHRDAVFYARTFSFALRSMCGKNPSGFSGKLLSAMFRTPLVLIGFIVCSLSAGAATYPGNGDTGFGGAVGTGSLTLTDDGTNLLFTFTRGMGTFDNYLVFYFDTVGGGVNSLPTSGEIGSPFGARRAIVNEFGSGISSFPTNFGADYAYALRVTGQDSASQVYQIPSGANANTLNFVSNVGVTNNGDGNAASYSFSIPFSDLGITAGQSFSFVTTYLDPFGGGGADATFRSAEAFVTTPTGTGFSNSSFTTAITYQTVPEPGTWIGAGLAVCVLAVSQRRRLARAIR
jgi:PEP-CTERM motif-containing protein